MVWYGYVHTSETLGFLIIIIFPCYILLTTIPMKVTHDRFPKSVKGSLSNSQTCIDILSNSPLNFYLRAHISAGTHCQKFILTPSMPSPPESLASAPPNSPPHPKTSSAVPASTPSALSLRPSSLPSPAGSLSLCVNDPVSPAQATYTPPPRPARPSLYGRSQRGCNLNTFLRKPQRSMEKR
jgi:hypothetical protein